MIRSSVLECGIKRDGTVPQFNIDLLESRC